MVLTSVRDRKKIQNYKAILEAKTCEPWKSEVFNFFFRNKSFFLTGETSVRHEFVAACVSICTISVVLSLLKMHVSGVQKRLIGVGLSKVFGVLEADTS